MSSINNLKDLAEYLREQAESPTDPDRIKLADDEPAFATILGVASQTLGITALTMCVKPEDIPTDPGKTLVISTAFTPRDAADTFLNLIGQATRMTFWYEASVANGNEELQLMMEITLRSWNFGTSFQEMTDQPVNELIPEDTPPHFGFASTNTQIENGVPLQKGLNYYSSINLEAADAFFQLLKSKPPALSIHGPLTPTDQGYTFDLHVPLTNELKPFYHLKVSSPWIGMKAVYVSYGKGEDGEDSDTATEPSDNDNGDKEEYTLLAYPYLGLEVEIDHYDNGKTSSVTLVIETSVSKKLDTVTFALTSPNPGDTSLDNIGNLIGGDSWDNLVPADFRDKYLSRFALTSFTLALSLKNLLKPSALALGLGTIEPWPVPFTNAKLDFGMDWHVTWVDSHAMQSATLWGELELADDFVFDVAVTIPDFVVTGGYSGTVTLDFSLLAQKIQQWTGSSMPVPQGLPTFSFSDLQIMLNTKKGGFDLQVTTDASIKLFGTQILGIHGLLILVNRPESGKDVVVTLNGMIEVLGINFDVNATVSKEKTEFETHMVDQTVGSLITYLGRLVDPYFDISLPTPWNALLDIKLDALTLKVDVTNGKVYFTYDANIHFAFIDITKIGLIYQKAKTNPKTGAIKPSSTQLSLACTFFGQSYGADDPMSWDPMNDPPPATPGSETAFDLNYLGLGQHVTPEIGDLETMTGIITAMQKAMVPVDAGTGIPSKLPGIRFDANSHWLIATRFSLRVVELIAIFNDPNLYGLRVSVSSSAQSLGGLEFEILYKKVTPTIGLYHLELTLPDSMRQLQFGEVSVTLPVVVLDIYTNGNFRVDVGFPKGLDFSRSCSVQVFPFVGFGGFYFALLSGATSRNVPKISNGSFDPVIEFGLALSIGVGKTIDKGPLDAGLYVTVIGILEGVLGFFHKESNSSTDALYYHVKGTVAIVGKVYGKVDFKVIKVEVSVTAYAEATLLVESHQPIHISIRAGVSVSAKVKVLFVTVHFSFKMTVKASFTIGSATPTPWHVIEARRGGGQTMLGQQPTLRPVPDRGVPVLSDTLLRESSVRGLVNNPRRFASLRTTLEAAARQDDLTSLTLLLCPAFTQSEEPLVAEPEVATDSSNRANARIVLLPFVKNALSSDGKASSRDVRVVGDQAENPLTQLASHLLAWVITTHLSGRFIDSAVVNADDLRKLLNDLTSNNIEQTGCTYEKLLEFLKQNFTLTLQSRPVEADDHQSVSGSIFPILPALTMTTEGNPAVDFSSCNLVDKDYEEKIAAYLSQLMVEYETSVESDYDKKKKKDSGDAGAGSQTFPTDDIKQSMATVIFQDYFVMMARMAVQGAIDLLEEYPYSVPAGTSPSLDQIAESFSVSETEYTCGKDETLQTISVRFGLPVSAIRKANVSVAETPHADHVPEGLDLTIPIGALTQWITSHGDTLNSLAHHFRQDVGIIKELNPHLAEVTPDQSIPPGTRVLMQVKVTPENIVLANQDNTKILKPGATMRLTGVTYQSGAGDTFTSVADKFAKGDADFLKNMMVSNQDKPLLQAGTRVTFTQTDANLVYTTHKYDTINLVAFIYLVRSAGFKVFNYANNLSEVVAEIIALDPLPPPADPSAKMGPDTRFKPGTELNFKLPDGEKVNYLTNDLDTPRLVATYFLALTSNVSMPDAPFNALDFINELIELNHLGDIDPAKELPTDTKLKIPTFSYAVNAGDTLARIRGLFGNEMEYLANIADLLAVHSVLDIPDFDYPVDSGNSLKGIAAKYNLSLDDLTAAMESQQGLFVENATLTIPQVPSRHTTDLIDDLVTLNRFDDTAAMVSRFLLHGLRLPVNTSSFSALTAAEMHRAEISSIFDTGPLFALIGQQFIPPSSLEEGYEIGLTKSDGFDWISFSMDRYYAEAGTTLDDLAEQFTEAKVKKEFEDAIKTDNPKVEFPLKEATWLNFRPSIPLQAFAINLTGSEVIDINNLQKAEFDPDVTGLYRLPLFRDTPFRWSLQKRILWQAASLPQDMFSCRFGSIGDLSDHLAVPG